MHEIIFWFWFVTGTVDVSGSAAYLADLKSNNRQARVSLGYKSETYKRYK